MSTPRTRPFTPSLITQKSCPPPRRRRDSHPSIHLPFWSYLSGTNTGSESCSRRDLSAKNSSLARIACEPSRGEAKLTLLLTKSGRESRGDIRFVHRDAGAVLELSYPLTGLTAMTVCLKELR